MQRDSLRRFAEAEELVEDVVWVAKRRETLAWSRVKRLGGRQTDTVERDADILCVEKTLTAVLVIEHATVSYHERPYRQQAVNQPAVAAPRGGLVRLWRSQDF